ncbi:hypothetical protein Aperf_G00000041874 [Anoplocephala perfoliata]
MRDTHWNPRFIQLSLDLAGRLSSARASCTNHMVDRWPDAQLTLLNSPDQTSSTISASGSHLATFHLLKYILTNSMPLESVFQTSPIDISTGLDNWPQEYKVVCISNKVQQHFAEMRSVILTARRAAPQTQLPTPPPPPTIPTSASIFNPPVLQPTRMALPLFLLAQSNPYLLPSPPIPLLTPSTSMTLTGNLLIDILALTSPPTASLQLPLRLPTVLPQTILPSVSTALPVASVLPALFRGDQPLQQRQEPQKTSFCYIQAACFKDEAKTRFMCSKCNKQWTSMKGAITFVVILSHQTTPFQEVEVAMGATGGRQSHQQRLIVTLHPGANVLFELFPQACADCASHGEVRLSPPKWYPEEVDKVLRNLFVNIHRTFYKNMIFWEHQFDRRRRAGHPTGRHDNTKCLACLNGMCVSAIGQPSNQLHTVNGESVDPSNQSECSPACKRRLVPSTKEDLK